MNIFKKLFKTVVKEVTSKKSDTKKAKKDDKASAEQKIQAAATATTTKTVRALPKPPKPQPPQKPITFAGLLDLIKKKPSQWKQLIGTHKITDLEFAHFDRVHLLSLIEVLKKEDRMDCLTTIPADMLRNIILNTRDGDAGINYKKRYTALCAEKKEKVESSSDKIVSFEYILLLLPATERFKFLKLLDKKTVLTIVTDISLFVAIAGMLQAENIADFIALTNVSDLSFVKNHFDLLDVISIQSDKEQAEFMKAIDVVAFLKIYQEAIRLSEFFAALKEEVKDVFKSRPDYQHIILPSMEIAKFQAELKAYQEKLQARKDSTAKTKKLAKLTELMDKLTIQDADRNNPTKYAKALQAFEDEFNSKQTRKMFSDSLSGLRKAANWISFGRHKKQLTPYKKTFTKNVKGVLNNPSAFFQHYGLVGAASDAEVAVTPRKSL